MAATLAMLSMSKFLVRVCPPSLRVLWQLPLQPDTNAPPRLAMACLGQPCLAKPPVATLGPRSAFYFRVPRSSQLASLGLKIKLARACKFPWGVT